VKEKARFGMRKEEVELAPLASALRLLPQSLASEQKKTKEANA
jgi:hypothetical protein